MKELKLTKDNDIDKNAMLQYADLQIKDASWKLVFKSAIEECYNEIKTKKDEIIMELEKAPFNIKRDQCNVTYMTMITCIHLEGYEVHRKIRKKLILTKLIFNRLAQQHPGIMIKNVSTPKFGLQNVVTKSSRCKNCSKRQRNKLMDILTRTIFQKKIC